MSDELRDYLGEQADRLFADHCTRELRQAAEDGDFPTPLWEALEDAGFTMVLVPEDEGGSGAGWPEAEVLLRAAGRHAAPVPLAETLLGAWLLARNGIEVPNGPLTIADGDLTLADGKVSGVTPRVPWGRNATHIVCAAGNEICLMDTGAAKIERGVFAYASW